MYMLLLHLYQLNDGSRCLWGHLQESDTFFISSTMLLEIENLQTNIVYIVQYLSCHHQACCYFTAVNQGSPGHLRMKLNVRAVCLPGKSVLTLSVDIPIQMRLPVPVPSAGGSPGFPL